MRSFREDSTSFNSNPAVSSTASSPGHTTREEINPATYSFTTALKALQAKTMYAWEYAPRDGFSSLSSKWDEAEKYISNPLSGEVPVECLSAKTLSGRSFRSLTSRISMSAPLFYTSNLNEFHAKPPIQEFEDEGEIPCQKKKTRDVGTQSTPADLGSSSPSPAPTPSIEERPIKYIEAGVDSSVCCSEISKSEIEIEVKESTENPEPESHEGASCNTNKIMMLIGCSSSKSGSRQWPLGCFSVMSLKGLWMRTRQKSRPSRTKKHMTL